MNYEKTVDFQYGKAGLLRDIFFGVGGDFSNSHSF